MFYAELYPDDPDEPIERGIFLSLEEFAPYYERGWRGTEQTNETARQYIEKSNAQRIAARLRQPKEAR